MAEMICIYDEKGRKICYTNHAAPRGAQVPYTLWTTPRGKRKPTVLRSGKLPRAATCLEKLAIVVAMANAMGSKGWKRIRHRH